MTEIVKTLKDVYDLIQFITSIHAALKNVFEDSVAERYSREEFEIALYDLNSAKTEQNPRDGLNRALCHLESAYAHYRIKYGFFDNTYNQQTDLNNLCIYISIIHYILNNENNAKEWLNSIIPEGGKRFPKEIIKSLSFDKIEDYIELITGDSFETFDNSKKISIYIEEKQYYSSYNEDSHESIFDDPNVRDAFIFH